MKTYDRRKSRKSRYCRVTSWSLTSSQNWTIFMTAKRTRTKPIPMVFCIFARINLIFKSNNWINYLIIFYNDTSLHKSIVEKKIIIVIIIDLLTFFEWKLSLMDDLFTQGTTENVNVLFRKDLLTLSQSQVIRNRLKISIKF